MEILPFPLQLPGRQSRRMRQVRKKTYPQNNRLFGRIHEGNGEKSAEDESQGGHDGWERTTPLIYDYIS